MYLHPEPDLYPAQCTRAAAPSLIGSDTVAGAVYSCCSPSQPVRRDRGWGMSEPHSVPMDTEPAWE